MALSKVSETLAELQKQLAEARDGELMIADECLTGHITDHNDNGTWREKERAVNRLAKAWDKMIAELGKWEAKAASIEASVDSFYGD